MGGGPSCEAILLQVIVLLVALSGLGTQLPSCLQEGATILGPQSFPTSFGIPSFNCTLSDAVTGKLQKAHHVYDTDRPIWYGLEYGRLYNLECLPPFTVSELVYTNPDAPCHNEECSCGSLQVRGQVDGILRSRCEETGVYTGNVQANNFIANTVYAIVADTGCGESSDSNSNSKSKSKSKSKLGKSKSTSPSFEDDDDDDDCHVCSRHHRYVGDLLTNVNGTFSGLLTLSLGSASRDSRLSFIPTNLQPNNYEFDEIISELESLENQKRRSPVFSFSDSSSYSSDPNEPLCPPPQARLRRHRGPFECSSSDSSSPGRSDGPFFSGSTDSKKRDTAEPGYVAFVKKFVDLGVKVDWVVEYFQAKTAGQLRTVVNEVATTVPSHKMDTVTLASLGGTVVAALVAGFILGRRGRQTTSESSRLL